MRFNKSRVRKHKDNITSFLMKLDSECRQLRFELNEDNKEEIVEKLVFKTILQKKYRRYYKLLNI